MTQKLQNKFAAGDRVVRTCEYTAVSDGGFMKKGEEYRVETVLNDREIRVEGSSIDYSSLYFKLVQPTFRNMKFRVNSPEHSKEIQEALFEMGFCWRSHGCEVRFADSFPPCDYLYTDTEGHLWRIDSEEDYLVSSFKSAQEFTVQTTKSYKLIPVETPKETITIDGKTYDKEAVLKRLAELESISK